MKNPQVASEVVSKNSEKMLEEILVAQSYPTTQFYSGVCPQDFTHPRATLLIMEWA